MGTVYSDLKFLGFPDHIEALRDHRVVAPVHVRIKPINKCNHSCWYCAYRADQLQLGEGMSLTDRLPEEKMSEIVEDVIAMGVRAVTFSGGGEPLLYKSLPDHVRRLHAGGVQVAALTNGANLKGAMADAFAECGRWVRVSLDAWDDESYAKQRSIKEGDFSLLLENMKSFVARGSDCTLGVSLIVGKDNHTHIIDTCKVMRDIGVDHVKVSGAIVSNDITENNAYHREIQEETIRQINQAEAMNSDAFGIVNHYHEMEGRFTKSYEQCPFLMFLTVIGADQMVYTCQDKAYTDGGCLGSIRDQTFREFCFSAESREKIYALNPSRDCAHHCVAHSKNMVLSEIMSLNPQHGVFV